MATLVTRLAEVHIPSYRDCLDAVARERRYIALHEAPPLEAVRAFVLGGMAGGAIQFVALDDERVVGWCDVHPALPHAMRHRGRLGMGLRSEHRGRGLGRQLLDACIADARVRGLTRIELEVRADNAPAIGLYERAGFVSEGRRKRAMRFGEEYFDSLEMALML